MTGGVTILLIYQEFSSRELRERLKESGVFFAKTIVAFPSGFIFRMIQPLDLEEFDRLLTGSTFSLIKNTDGIFWIRQIFPQFKHFMIHSSNRILEAATKLGYMKDIMHLRKIWRQLQLICHFFLTGKNTEWANVARS